MTSTRGTRPDGERIAFVSDRSGRFEVWVMLADSTDKSRWLRWAAGVAWTADSQAIVFRGERDRQMQICRVDVASGALAPLPPARSGGPMSFSPAQTLIMDVSSHKVHPIGGSEPYEIYQFPDPDVRIDYPRWSHDGRRLVFDRAAPRGADLWTLEGF